MSQDSIDKFTDREYLTTEQYQNAGNLTARMNLHRRFGTNKQDLKAWIFSHLKDNLTEKSRILELGCGTGDLWGINASEIPAGWSLVLSDISAGMLENTKQALSETSLKVQFKAFDAQKIPFEDGYFDGVVANHMLYHVPDRAKALAEIQRVLKPGGVLFAATNGANHMVEMRQLIKSIDPHAHMFAVPDAFGLETGQEQLAPFFADIQVFRFENALVVTERDLYVAYILSLKWSALIEENSQLAAKAIDEKLKADGAIRIRLDVGMFVATKAA